METAISYSSRLQISVAGFWKRLKETPLLLGWLVVGLLIAARMDGWAGLLVGIVNLLLLGVYVILIRAMTAPPAPLPLRRPRLELAAALALLGLLFTIQMLDFGVWTAQHWQARTQGFFAALRTWVFGLGLPDWAQGSAAGAVSSAIKQTLPTLLLFLLFGYGRQAMGLARPHARLTGALVGLTAAFGLLAGVLFRVPPERALALYALGVFVNALPEELFFRAMLLPRLEKAFANPLNALVISALLFNAIHVPLALSQGQPLPNALLGIFRADYPTGLLWGYLYLRTRSILPGMFWHAANGRLGFVFFNF